MKLAFDIAVAVAVTIVAGWELQRLRRAPTDPGLRVLVPGLVLLAFTLVAGVHLWPLTLVDHFQDVTWIGNVIWVAMAWCYATFFVMADTERSIAARRRWARRSFVVLVVLVALSYVYVVLALNHVPGAPTAIARRFADAAIFLGALTFYALGSRRASRYLSGLSNGWVRAAVILVIVGAGGMTIGVDVITAIRYVIFNGSGSIDRDVNEWLSFLYNVGRIGGQLLLALGLGLAPLAALVTRVQRTRDRRTQHQLERSLRPLWRRLVTEFPFLVLTPGAETPAFGRMLTEITDALGHLSAFVPDAGPDAPATADHAAELAAAGLDARRAAQAATGDPEHARAEPPYPPLEPDFGADWRAQARWMQSIASALDARGYLRGDPAAAPASRLTAG